MATGERIILHCDCNSYFASVESILDPTLKKVPMAVCGDPQNRHGIILAKNEPAKKYGITTAEPVGAALRKCPDLVVVKPHHDLYKEYYHKINRFYLNYTSKVEPFSIDESWLDISGNYGTIDEGKAFADRLRAHIQEEIGLTISVGVSFNKIFAKLGSDYKKPDATTLISRDNYQQILYPLPVESMMYVGKKSAQRLHRYGVQTIGDLANLKSTDAERILGKTGRQIWEYAQGRDGSPVRHFNEKREAKSISHEITFARDLLGEEDIRRGMRLLADKVGARLRKAKMFCNTVKVRIKDSNFRVRNHQKRLLRSINETDELYKEALNLIFQCWDLSRPIRLISVAAADLSAVRHQKQMDLFQTPIGKTKSERLDDAVDEIRRRFGQRALFHAFAAKTDILPRVDNKENAPASCYLQNNMDKIGGLEDSLDQL